jgi:hypothetical protein
VNGDYYCCAWDAGLEQNGRQLRLGPLVTDSVAASRSVFVPPSGGFARYLEVLYNPLPFPQTITVYIGAYPNTGSATRWVVSPVSTGYTYAVSDHSWNRQPTRASLGYVMAGTGQVPVPVTAAEFYGNGNRDFAFQYTVTVPPSQSVAVLHYALQRHPGDAASAQAAAEALVNLTDPNALAGLSDAEKAMIVNFKIPQ